MTEPACHRCTGPITNPNRMSVSGFGAAHYQGDCIDTEDTKTRLELLGRIKRAASLTSGHLPSTPALRRAVELLE